MLCHREKAIDLCTTKNIKISIACIICSSIIVNSPRVFENVWDTSVYGNLVKTDFGCSYGFQAGYMLWFTMAIRFLIPSIILVFTNIQLFRKVTLNKLSRSQDQVTNKKKFCFYTFLGFSHTLNFKCVNYLCPSSFEREHCVMKSLKFSAYDFKRAQPFPNAMFLIFRTGKTSN